MELFNDAKSICVITDEAVNEESNELLNEVNEESNKSLNEVITDNYQDSISHELIFDMNSSDKESDDSSLK
ncbi:12234_t:CDS:1, partial [Racocetra persica]